MQINNNMNTVSFMQKSTNAEQVGEAERRPPPPPGQLPPGLSESVSTLSEAEQTELKELFASFSPEQHEQVKTALDALKSKSTDMTSSELGETFYQLISQIAGVSSESDDFSDGVDIFV